jgi:hypothetical protein
MFLDTSGCGPGGKPDREPAPERRLTLREEKTLFWIAGFNLVLLLVAPIGGATLFDLAIHMFR